MRSSPVPHGSSFPVGFVNRGSYFVPAPTPLLSEFWKCPQGPNKVVGKDGDAWVGQAKSDINVGLTRSALSAGTPEYLKEALGMKKPKHARFAASGYIPGTPSYKEKEDMYDEILHLKKEIQAQKCEGDRMKTKFRRLEEENNRKDKQLEQLLDSSRGSEFVGLRTEPRSDSSWVINGLKQKILKLEQQCKEKDNTIKYGDS
ncbi:PREDICTED: IQ domain-containing protein E [Gekko japonicus]|uniref:IQ domain-containing protein E n=1 Tax=Gekko japonicus TaxID=146911 RepID=A0ABM1KKC6_GEKJA|nr:PREDICTED: IQ domain-containing protein E [Gekko japonicus]